MGLLYPAAWLKTMDAPPINISICFDLATAAGRQLAGGVIDYIRASTPWQLTTGDADATLTQAAGALPTVEARIARTGKSAVVTADIDAAAKLAIEHLIERGFRQITTIDPPADWQRAVAAAAPPGVTISAASWPADLLQLPRSTAIICISDAIAAEVAQAASAAALAVPHTMAILGFGDDELTCELATTPLSSIDPNTRQIGYQAAAQIERLLTRRSVRAVTLVPPRGVALRASTDVLSIADADIAQAVRFIRANAHRPLAIADVLREVPLHRRSLERGFRKYLGRSPAAELRHARVQIAMKLLARTDQPIAEVARRAGFLLSQHLAAAFKQVQGMTPSAYRAQFKQY